MEKSNGNMPDMNLFSFIGVYFLNNLSEEGRGFYFKTDNTGQITVKNYGGCRR